MTRSLVLLAVVVTLACASEPPTVQWHPPPVLQGRYTGRWQILVRDTIYTCAGGYCNLGVLTVPSCDFTVDFVMPTSDTYMGHLAVDTLNGCEAQDVPGVPFHGITVAGSLTGTYVPTSVYGGGAEITMVVGDSSTAALEALYGC